MKFKINRRLNFSELKRIAIIGPPGSGKSTLARKIGEITGIEYHHLDKYYHNAGWVPKPKDEFRKIVAELVSKDEWIIDGNYRGTLELRALRADLIVYINYPSVFSIYRIYKRIFKSKLGLIKRNDIPEDCYEAWIPLDLILWTWNFNRKNKPDIFRILNDLNINESVINILNNLKETEKFLKEFSLQYENK